MRGQFIRILALMAVLLLPAFANAAAEPENINRQRTYTFSGLKLTPTDTVPRVAEGVFYYDDSENAIKVSTDGATYTAIGRMLVATVDYATTDTARTVTIAETGYIFRLTTIAGTAADVVFNLPSPATVGTEFTFIDDDPAANADLVIHAVGSCTINGGTAAKEYVCTGDAAKQVCTIVAVSTTEYKVRYELGTWANDNG